MAIIWPCTTRRGAAMENVALNHEKCRYCPFSSGNEERKKNRIKKRTRRRRQRSSSGFSYPSETVEAKRFPNGFPAQRLQGTKLKLSVSLSAGRYEERAAKLAKPHSRLGLPCSSRGTPSNPPIFASASHPRKKADIGSCPLSPAPA